VKRPHFVGAWLTALVSTVIGAAGFAFVARGADGPAPPRNYRFDGTISRAVLENYLSRAITMEGLLNGRGDLEDNIRMLRATGAKFIGRSLCLWGGEGQLLSNLQRAKQQAPRLHQADPEMILQGCIFEIVTTQVDRVPVPDWAFVALGQPVENRNFRYADMLYPNGRFRNHWRDGHSVPDVSRPETKLWFYFLGASFIDAGLEAIHFGQTELIGFLWPTGRALQSLTFLPHQPYSPSTPPSSPKL
jgi:hypothetical protein